MGLFNLSCLSLFFCDRACDLTSREKKFGQISSQNHKLYEISLNILKLLLKLLKKEKRKKIPLFLPWRLLLLLLPPLPPRRLLRRRRLRLRLRLRLNLAISDGTFVFQALCSWSSTCSWWAFQSLRLEARPSDLFITKCEAQKWLVMLCSTVMKYNGWPLFTASERLSPPRGPCMAN